MALCFILTILLGICLSFVINLSIHALTFHFGDQEGNVGLVNFIISFLAGSFFPLAFLHGATKTIFMSLPFRFLFDFPANVFMGKIPLNEILLGWAQISLWSIIFGIILIIIYQTGLKKYTGTGR
jgi:ABC-2 type transport system permease protein